MTPTPCQYCINHINETAPSWYPGHLHNMMILYWLKRLRLELEPVEHGYSRHCTQKAAELVGMDRTIVT
jgi:hypothetical protein